jgi:hypothetical protein
VFLHYSYGILKGTNIDVYLKKNHKDAKEVSLKNEGKNVGHEKTKTKYE